MRWTVRFCLLIFVAWIAFTISPYIALYRLSQAIENRNAAALAEHINLKAFRMSLTRQLVGDYLDHVGRSNDLNPLDKKLAVEAAATVADPIVAQLLTPQALVDLLDDGWPQQLVAESSAPLKVRLDTASLRRIWHLYWSSESRGFRMITVILPDHATPDERYRVQLRLSGLKWQLSGLELPKSLRQRLIERIPSRTF